MTNLAPPFVGCAVRQRTRASRSISSRDPDGALAIAGRGHRRSFLRLIATEKFLQDHYRAFDSVHSRLEVMNLCPTCLVFLPEFCEALLNLFPHFRPSYPSAENWQSRYCWLSHENEYVVTPAPRSSFPSALPMMASGQTPGKFGRTSDDDWMACRDHAEPLRAVFADEARRLFVARAIRCFWLEHHLPSERVSPGAADLPPLSAIDPAHLWSAFFGSLSLLATACSKSLGATASLGIRHDVGAILQS